VTEIRGNPRLGIGIINQLADNLRQMGGVGRTPMASTRFSPRPQLAFCTLYSTPLFGFQRRSRA
jgi:hypothetical protein